ncbi:MULTISPECIES: hypothetical protein [unclassified Anabaena]|nr:MULTISPECIES: hypothetical protein [unclassified Anabaena]
MYFEILVEDVSGKTTPFMDIDNNQSLSFCYFRDQLRRLSGQ